MKSIFSIGKIFSFCFLVIYTFSSCKSTITINGTEVPKKIIIKITGYEVSTGQLTMVDEQGKPADIIQAWPSQKIKWKIKGSGIKSIVAMPPKKSNKNAIFKEEPHKKVLCSTWKGIIKNEGAIKENGVVSDSGIYNYDYDIKWKLPKKDDIYTYDPRIQIKL